MKLIFNIMSVVSFVGILFLSSVLVTAMLLKIKDFLKTGSLWRKL